MLLVAENNPPALNRAAAAWLVERWNLAPGVVRCHRVTPTRVKKVSKILSQSNGRDVLEKALISLCEGCALPKRATLDWFLSKGVIQQLSGGSCVE